MKSNSESILNHDLNSQKILLWSRIALNLYKYKFMYLLLLPGIIYLLVFHYYPLYFLVVAFKKYSVFKGIEGSPWIGFHNFRIFFSNEWFNQALWNTIIISFMKKLFGFPIPIILAILLNEIRHSIYKRTVQTVIYLPHFLSWVIVGGIWITLLSPSGGLVNEILKLFGVKPIFFMIQPKLFRWILVFTGIWKDAGWSTIIYLAAISGIDNDIYEASLIDGANRFKQALHITLPCILPTIIVVFVLSLAKILNLFEQVFVMYNPLVAPVSETIETFVYKIGIQNGDISLATAVGLFKNVVSLVLVLATNQIAKKLQGSSVI